jgi:hypothetical protein
VAGPRWTSPNLWKPTDALGAILGHDDGDQERTHATATSQTLV